MIKTKKDLKLAQQIKKLKEEFPQLPSSYVGRAVTERTNPGKGLFSISELANEKVLLTALDLSAMLRVSRAAICQWMKAGQLPYIRIGKCVRFDPEQIRDWLKVKYSQRFP